MKAFMQNKIRRIKLLHSHHMMAMIVCMIIQISTNAQSIDSIDANDKRLEMRYLRMGTTKWLVYFRDSTGNISRPSYWVRSVTKKDKQIIVQQNWDSEVAMQRREVHSISTQDMVPLFHSGSSPMGKQAFDFHPESVRGSDTAVGITNRTFNMNIALSPFNWELDLEILPLLPLKDQKRIAACFYHPGSIRPPQYYLYTVKGSKELIMFDNTKVDCWLLHIVYDAKNNSEATFYITKKDRRLVRVEETSGKIIRIKELMAVSDH